MWYFNSVIVYEADAWLTHGKTYAQYICKATGLATAGEMRPPDDSWMSSHSREYKAKDGRSGFGSKKGNGFDTKFA
jgi:hypothetical protein